MNNMNIIDKVAIILTKHGFSLSEGAEIYSDTVQKGEIVNISIDNDCVLWCEEEGSLITINVWKNYKKDFCLNYSLAGAIALDDDELEVYDEDKELILNFFKSCQKAERNNEPMPIIPKKLHWLFTSAALTDYMETNVYQITDRTRIDINLMY